MNKVVFQEHNIPPVFDEKSQILILGSFPSVKSREGRFFYNHPQNRFWRVLADIFQTKTPETIDEKKSFLLEQGIAVWDVIASCSVCGSSDSSIKDVTPNEINKILLSSKIRKIYCNGNTSFKLYNMYLRNSVGIDAVKLPSTSPANAAFSFEKLCEYWRKIK